MNIATWEQLFDELGAAAVANISEGRITKQLAQYWKENGLPTNEHTGLANRSKYIVQAAQAKGIKISRAKVLLLSNEFRVNRALREKEGAKNV